MTISADFYLNSNMIRELILSLCHLSQNVFEISLNSSLVTDDLMAQEETYKSYGVYAEKISQISNALNLSAREMLNRSTHMMEISLQNFKYHARVQKLNDGLEGISKPTNIRAVRNAILLMEEKMLPLGDEARSVLYELISTNNQFRVECKKLWLLTTNLKAQVEYDEIYHLTNITQKIENVLNEVEQKMGMLDGQFLRLKERFDKY